MDDALIKFLSQYISLTEEEIQIINEHNIIREYKKDAILLSEGQVARECFLVLKGCVKSHYLHDGEEKITEFYTEHEPVTPVSYTTQEPSTYFLTCVEPCILSVGTPDKTQQFLKALPRFAPAFMKISNELLAKNQVSFDTFKHLSPEERYQKLYETRPDLVQRVPQYQIASYLGIKPQSLSRIRNRLSKK